MLKTSVAVASPIHGCYITNWAVYTQEPYKVLQQTVPVGLCTHIFYAFAAINVATFEAQMTDEWSDIGLGNFAKTQALKKTNPGMKTLLSFGGWTESLSGIYNTMASDPAKRAKFIASAWKLANDNGFDGIDMDWEYPGTADRATFVALIKELKEASGGKLVTAAVSAGIDKIDAGYDVPAFEPFIDLLTVMTYDFHGSWENVVGHRAAYSETVAALAHWASIGIPKSKLLMGIGAYGRGWIANPCAPGTVSRGIAPAQRITQEAGIAALLEMVAMNGVTIQFPDGPFLQATLNGQNACFGYDDRAAILRKMDFVKREGYGGAFSWTIDFDDAFFAVHNAIKDGLSGATPPSPTSASRSNQTARTSRPVPSQSTSSPSRPSPTVPSAAVTQSIAAPIAGPCLTGDLRANSNPKKYEQCLFGS
ncbi:hypothetical protein PENTCL1PPCAC_4334 [Pristionchus entomophagus]|uniref:GH18 domain-containing protein n=1 Tax=Pristionchus entomophagus TaxID=358040 RepID=A0AAV5SH36_9BILA|nr:hypothetical protein PENTCL1PPCAC_4334 [Pristionchus entomophagus]